MVSRRVRVKSFCAAGAGLLIAGLLAACTGTGQPAQAHRSQHKKTSAKEVAGGPTGQYVVPPGIHKIKHVIIIMQENRSFDSYFGTYPGVDGIPMQQREAHGVRARPERRLHPALPRHRRTSTAAARTARATRWPTSITAR